MLDGLRMDGSIRVVGTYLWLIKCVGRFSLTNWGWSCYFEFCTNIMAGFGILKSCTSEVYEECINSSSSS